MFIKRSGGILICLAISILSQVEPVWGGEFRSSGDMAFLERMQREYSDNEILGVAAVFSVQGERIPVDRAVVAKKNEYFRALFVGGLRESVVKSSTEANEKVISTKSIEISEINSDFFIKILRLIVDQKFDPFDENQDRDGNLTAKFLSDLFYFQVKELQAFLDSLVVKDGVGLVRAMNLLGFLEIQEFGSNSELIRDHLKAQVTIYIKKRSGCYKLDSIQLLKCLPFEALFDWIPGMKLLMDAPSGVASTEKDELYGRFVQIPGGTFQMGSPAGELDRNVNERQHLVTLSPFEIGEAAVTQEAYAKVMGVNPSHFKEQRFCPDSFKLLEVGEIQIPVCADHPVESVSWDDAVRFIAKLNEQDAGYRYRLPTEAELEFTYRGGTVTAYVSGDTEEGLGEFAWCKGNSRNQTDPVKSKNANAFGIYRSSVWEWIGDLYGEYAVDATIDPRGPDAGSHRVIRGGSWNRPAFCVRSAYRAAELPDFRGSNLGFRMVRVSN